MPAATVTFPSPSTLAPCPIKSRSGFHLLPIDAMKLLVVEDEPIHMKLASLVLVSHGHEVTEAEAAAEACEQISKSRPDAILLDLDLPGIDGLTLARMLKSDERTR